jgi:hypothetical protein
MDRVVMGRLSDADHDLGCSQEIAPRGMLWTFIASTGARDVSTSQKNVLDSILPL